LLTLHVRKIRVCEDVVGYRVGYRATTFGPKVSLCGVAVLNLLDLAGFSVTASPVSLGNSDFERLLGAKNNM
jgi:hypothetical protein